MGAPAQNGTGDGSGNGNGDGGGSNGEGQGGQNGGEGGQGEGQGKQNGQDGNQGGGSSVDLTKLSGAELEKVLENPELFKLPRIKEFRDAAAELKTIKDKQAKEEQERLEKEGNHKEVNDSLKAEKQALEKKIQDMTINQALTGKLVPEGVVDLDGALKLIDRSKITVDDSGNVQGLDDAISGLKTGKAYLFSSDGNNQSVGSATNGNNDGTGNGNSGDKPKFKRSQLKDSDFYNAHRDEILEAQRNGMIEDDLGAPQPPK
jgi:hypothetical protein